ncbi:methyl-accepting chemotaxis protein [Aeromonas veronii]|uniref:methyl-accepting chemotaxis protein n=1 Tax=Aeromonas veronii TaxID=654 RepID=UPI00214D44A1|nr:methyl-accepting chemotaxis protein [Aeromonas veronii]MCR3972852.1 methyl-accepting chemotaxis protein [Aeromonas veronii]MCR3977172.1 methyl-accepting chemotaxis protein [Aeromonas veronii]
MFPPRKLGHQITLLAIGGIVLLAVVLLTFNLFENRQRALAAEQAALRSQLQNVEAVIKNTSHETVLAATLIAQRPDAAKAVADKDWQALANLFDPLWPAIKAQGIEQFQFHLPPATSLYRVHKPEKHGDDLSAIRPTVVEVNREHHAVGGLEIGVAGTGLRGVVPVTFNGQPVGSVEFGRALDEKLFGQLLDKQVQLAIYLFEQGKLVTLVGTSRLGEAMEWYQPVLAGEERFVNMTQQGSDLLLMAAPLRDYSGKAVGIIELTRDHSLVAADLARQGWQMAIISLVGALVIAMVMAFALNRINRPLLDSVKALEALANGSGDLGSKLPVAGPEETRRLGAAFNAFVGKIRDTISQLTATLGELAGESERLSRSAAGNLGNMTRQQEQTTQLATAMTEMTSTVHEVANNTAQAAEAANEADNQAVTGDEVVQQSVNMIEQLAEEIASAGNTVKEVAKASEQIGSVLAVIQSIAEQTNLLALNAAIEAARAGEQGRGFAVVADEVRSLAGRTQHSTAEIRGTIEQLQRAVGTTVTMIEHSVSRAGESVERANQAGEALGRIKGAVNSIRDMNTQIAAASEEQSSVSDEITRNIVSVHEISQATTLVARDTAHIASHVATLVDKLGDLAGQFQDGSNVRMVLSRARAAHMGWKARVRAYLDGQEGLSRSEAVSDKECRLGHWYFSEGQACCGDQPAFRAIAAPHARLHQVIQQIIELKNQHKHEEAEALYREIEQNSEQVVGCIDQLLREMTKPER